MLNKRVIVTGATSQIGNFLLPLLLASDYEVIAISRKENSFQKNVKWIKANIADDEMILEGEYSTLFHLAPLTLLPNLLERITHLGIKRIIAFSTTSIFTKKTADALKDRELVTEFNFAEEKVKQCCQHNNIVWTIFRPTLIYGTGHDQNITFIANVIKKLGYFPLVNNGAGLRQPVHAEDLAKACMNVINTVSSFHRSYNLSGGEILSYREMVSRIFIALGKTPKFFKIPLVLMRAILYILSFLPRYKHLSTDMANRMNADHIFNHQDAINDFGYIARKFQLKRIL